MAFTRREFWRGVRASALSALLLLTVALAVSAWVSWTPSWGSRAGYLLLTLGYGVPFGAVVIVAVSALASPAAWVLGRALAGTPHIVTHLAAFAALGAAVGLLTLLGYALVAGMPAAHAFADVTPWALAAACAVAVAAGWCWTVSRARQERSMLPTSEAPTR